MVKKLPLTLCLLCSLNAPLASAAEALCKRWSEPVKTGQLDVKTIMEASGIAISQDGTKLFHINDGDSAFFYVTDASGGATQTVAITGFMPQDVEDLALGGCGRSTCLYVADIGDNAVRRQSVQFAIIQTAEKFGAEVAPIRAVTARYPDGPHDAEAIAIHPSGDLFLATKIRPGQQGPSLLFKLSAAQLAAGGEQTFTSMGIIPVPELSAALGPSLRRTVTSMDISPDGKRFMLLTYDAAIEFAVDLRGGLPGTWAEGVTHRAFPIATLLQAEAIAYERAGKSILYSTESIRGSEAQLMKQSCVE